MTKTLFCRSRRKQPKHRVGSYVDTCYRDVLSALNTSRPLFKSYLRIRSSASSANSPELREARSELEQTLQDLSQDLEDLVESVKAVEHDPYKFGLEIDEVERRRRLVKEVGDEIENMHEALQQTVQDAQKKGNMLPDPDSFEEDEDNYAQFEQEQQMQIMNEQDEALDGVFRTVGNLRMQADDMGRELEEQGEMLRDVDTVADRVGGKLQTGMKKVNTIIRKNEGKSFSVGSRNPLTSKQRQMVQLLHRSSHLCLDSAFGVATCTLRTELKHSKQKVEL
jgi:t-SNARE syntaxin family protein